MKPQTVKSVMRLAPWKTLHQHLRTQTTKLLTSLDHTNSQHPKVRLLITWAIAILIIKIICHSQVKHTVWNMLPEPTVSSQRSPSSTKKSSPKFQSKILKGINFDAIDHDNLHGQFIILWEIYAVLYKNCTIIIKKKKKKYKKLLHRRSWKLIFLFASWIDYNLSRNIFSLSWWGIICLFYSRNKIVIYLCAIINCSVCMWSLAYRRWFLWDSSSMTLVKCLIARHFNLILWFFLGV